MRSTPEDPKPKHARGPTCLRSRKTFYREDMMGRHQKELPEGAIVDVDDIEPIYDDHGRFCRYWYRLKHDIFWRSIAEERDITSPDVLDRLASI